MQHPPQPAISWHRPPIKQLNPTHQSLTFQCVTIDQYDTYTDQCVTVCRMFGVSEDGNSVCAHVHGFHSYVYAETDSVVDDDQLQSFRSTLVAELAGKCTSVRNTIINVEIVSNLNVVSSKNDSMTDSVNGFMTDSVNGSMTEVIPTKTLIRITLSTPQLVEDCKLILEKDLDKFSVYEAEVKHVDRFMVDMNLRCGSWVELLSNKYVICPNEFKKTSSQIEVDIHYQDVVVHPFEDKWSKMAPLRVLSFDIECPGERSNFSCATKDKVIQIATVCSLLQDVSSPINQTIHTLGPCDPIEGVDVISNGGDEKQLIASWQQHCILADPDIVIGYNILQFDFQYLIKRTTNLKIPFSFGREIGKPIGIPDVLDIPGVVPFDLYQIYKQRFPQHLLHEHELRNLTLGAVAGCFLTTTKKDMDMTEMSSSHQNNDGCRKIAEYCLQDAILPLQLMALDENKFNYFVGLAYSEGITIKQLLYQSVNSKHVSLLMNLRTAKVANDKNKKEQALF